MVKILLSTRNQSKKQYYIHNKKKNDGCLFGNDGDDNNMKTFKSKNTEGGKRFVNLQS